MAACEIIYDESVSGRRRISGFTFNSIRMTVIAFKTVKCPVFSCREEYFSVMVNYRRHEGIQLVTVRQC